MNEDGYLGLLREVLDAKPRKDRTGTGTRSVFGRQLRFDLREASWPLLTTKKMAWKTCLKELLWFLRGSTDATELQRDNVHIWDGNSTRAFLDDRGLTHLPEGDVGPTYGFQWRHYGAKYVDCKTPPTDPGFDQLEYVENLIRNDPTSRRIFLTAWNPGAISQMALPPCHVCAQFYVNPEQKTLSCHVYQRSADVFLGLPFNVASYAALTHILAHRAGLSASELVMSLGDAHLYLDHVVQATEQVSRDVYPTPKIALSDRVKIASWDELTIDDFDVTHYTCHPAIAAKMSV